MGEGPGVAPVTDNWYNINFILSVIAEGFHIRLTTMLIFFGILLDIAPMETHLPDIEIDKLCYLIVDWSSKFPLHNQ